MIEREDEGGNEISETKYMRDMIYERMEEEEEEEMRDMDDLGDAEEEMKRAGDAEPETSHKLSKELDLIGRQRTMQSSSTGSFLELPSTITRVRSSIVWDRTMSRSQKLVLLIMKYISDRGEMSVNLSHGTRQKMMEYMRYWTGEMEGDPATYEVNAFVFSEVAAELMRLMGDSYGRFQKTDNYGRLVTKSKGSHSFLAF